MLGRLLKYQKQYYLLAIKRLFTLGLARLFLPSPSSPPLPVFAPPLCAPLFLYVPSFICTQIPFIPRHLVYSPPSFPRAAPLRLRPLLYGLPYSCLFMRPLPSLRAPPTFVFACAHSPPGARAAFRSPFCIGLAAISLPYRVTPSKTASVDRLGLTNAFDIANSNSYQLRLHLNNKYITPSQIL